jgi:hypothetical protein
LATPLLLASLAIGILSVLIRLFHFLFGQWSTNATMDSRGRFYAAVFTGFGIAWIWAARQSPIPGATMQVLAGIAAQRVGRMISVLVVSWPHWLQVAEAGIELVLPLVFPDRRRREKAAASRHVIGAPSSAAVDRPCASLDDHARRAGRRGRATADFPHLPLCAGGVGVGDPADRVDALSPQTCWPTQPAAFATSTTTPPASLLNDGCAITWPRSPP